MKVEVKLLHDKAQRPKFGSELAAGADLYVTEVEETLFTVTYKFGIALQMPKAHYGLLTPRSSVWKTKQWMCNSVGIIDNDYRGEIQAKFYKIPFFSKLYKVGERAAQLIVRPQLRVSYSIFNGNLSKTARGEGGFGSTGK